MNKLSICTCGHYRALHRMDYEFRLLDCNVCDCKKYHQEPPKPVDAVRGIKVKDFDVDKFLEQAIEAGRIIETRDKPPKEPMTKPPTEYRKK